MVVNQIIYYLYNTYTLQNTNTEERHFYVRLLILYKIRVVTNIQLCFFGWEVVIIFKSYSFGENNHLEVLISETMLLLRIFHMTRVFVLLLCQHFLINLAFTKDLKMYISKIQLEYLYECQL